MQNGNLADWFISFLAAIYIWIWTFQKVLKKLLFSESFIHMNLQFFLAYALRNNLVQELVLTRLLEMSKPHLLCQKQYLFSFLSSEASAYVLFNPILSLQFIGLRRNFRLPHFLYILDGKTKFLWQMKIENRTQLSDVLITDNLFW